MSEFTPTTVQVLDAAVQTGFYSYAEVDRWHAAEIRRAKAEAWRELVVRLAYFEGLDLNEHPNPYRNEATNEHP